MIYLYFGLDKEGNHLQGPLFGGAFKNYQHGYTKQMDNEDTAMMMVAVE